SRERPDQRVDRRAGPGNSDRVRRNQSGRVGIRLRVTAAARPPISRVYNLGTSRGRAPLSLRHSPGGLAVPTNAPPNRKPRMGLVGGGQGAFIGRVHATAAVLDNRAALVAGALSSDPKKAKDSAPDYDIPPERAYGSYKEMAEAEAKRPDKI